jgi:hypothetical protein
MPLSSIFDIKVKSETPSSGCAPVKVLEKKFISFSRGSYTNRTVAGLLCSKYVTMFTTTNTNNLDISITCGSTSA